MIHIIFSAILGFVIGMLVAVIGYPKEWRMRKMLGLMLLLIVPLVLINDLIPF